MTNRRFCEAKSYRRKYLHLTPSRWEGLKGRGVYLKHPSLSQPRRSSRSAVEPGAAGGSAQHGAASSAAFTLLEMIVVVIILGVLASLAIPRYTFSFEKMRLAEGLQLLETLRSAQHTYRAENGSYANALALLDVEINAPANFAVPSVAAADPIATIVRAAPASYTLTLDAGGTIQCSGGSPVDICTRIGCSGGGGGDECN